MSRSEYVKCIVRGDSQGVETWCGKNPFSLGFCFVDSEHAALNGVQEGRMVACKECADKIIEGLMAGNDE